MKSWRIPNSQKKIFSKSFLLAKDIVKNLGTISAIEKLLTISGRASNKDSADMEAGTEDFGVDEREHAKGYNIGSLIDTGSVGKIGTYASFFLLVTGMVTSIVLQAYTPEDGTYLGGLWSDDCAAGYEDSCRANQAVLRVSFALVCLFATNFILTGINTTYFDNFWGYKILMLCGLMCGFMYINPEVFDENGYAWFARIGGFFYIILQQLIIMDFSLSWNEQWMKNSEDERSALTEGLDRWQIAVLCTGLSFITLSIVGNGLMLHYFSGCESNNVIISLSLVMGVLGLLYQLFFTHIGSVLTSGVMAIYYCYIAFASVTLQPDYSCNPTISDSPQKIVTALGLVITVLSLSWTVYSTIKTLPSLNTKESLHSEHSYQTPGITYLLLSVSAIFILGSCYYAMVLTNWVTLQQNFNMDSARVGKTSMWLNASASWVSFILYIWALTAPVLFPERF